MITHSLLLQVVSHLLVLVLRQLRIAVLIVLRKDGLNLGVCVALTAPNGKTTQNILRSL